jgi:hypothetical protein
MLSLESDRCLHHGADLNIDFSAFKSTIKSTPRAIHAPRHVALTTTLISSTQASKTEKMLRGERSISPPRFNLSAFKSTPRAIHALRPVALTMDRNVSTVYGRTSIINTSF